MTVSDAGVHLDGAQHREMHGPHRNALAARADAVAGIAAAHAASVDRDARFPAEAIAAARQCGLLGAMVPSALGGEGAGLFEIADVCYRLGQDCAATAMIYAMHQMTVASLLDFREPGGWHDNLLRRVAAGQMLLASSTTEGRGGGNVRSSEAAIEHCGDRIALERRASVISYALEADAIATTARRCADADATDQVLAVFTKEDYRLEPLTGWNTLGMRGTCSAGFVLRATGRRD